jgi:hypothetical protein
MRICKEFTQEFRKAAAIGLRLYFAPLVGAYRHTQWEWTKAYRELAEASVAGSRASKK